MCIVVDGSDCDVGSHGEICDVYMCVCVFVCVSVCKGRKQR